MNRLILSITIFLLISCAGVKVRTVSAPGFKASSYHSFCWIEGCEERYDGPTYALDKRSMVAIREKISKVLEEKNYINDQNAPDLLIGFHVIINEQQRLLSDSPEMSEPYQYPTSYWEDYASYYESQKIFKYLKGSLVIDVIDANSGSILWQSTTQGYMDINANVTEADLEKVITKAMHHFPVRTVIVPNNLTTYLP